MSDLNSKQKTKNEKQINNTTTITIVIRNSELINNIEQLRLS